MPRRFAKSCATVSRSAMARIAMRSVVTSIFWGAHSPPGTCRSQAGASALGDQLALELCQCREDAKDQAAVGRRGVDFGSGSGSGEHPQADAAAVQLIDRRHEMFQAAPQAVELPDDERVARLQGLQAGLQPRAVVMATRGAVLVDAPFVDAGSDQSIALQVEELRTVCLGNPGIADQHGVRASVRIDGELVGT